MTVAVDGPGARRYEWLMSTVKQKLSTSRHLAIEPNQKERSHTTDAAVGRGRAATGRAPGWCPLAYGAGMAENPELVVADVAAWRAWLDENESVSDGVWLVLAKKGKDGPTTLTRAQALEEVLCSGWIDAQARSRDDVTTLQRYCPRRPRSTWSVRNVGIAERLVTEGRMRPRGLAEMERAKADGRWDAAYEGPRNIRVPDELAAALAASPRAAAMFEVLSGQNRYAILHRLANLRTPEAHTRNVAGFVAMLERGETPYPQKRRPASPS